MFLELNFLKSNYSLARSVNENIFNEEEMNVYNIISDRIRDIIKIKFKINDLYSTKPIIFTELKQISKIGETASYTINNYDKSIYGTDVDYSAIIYLSSHHIDFKGGCITFNDTTSVLNLEPKTGNIKLKFLVSFKK
jgi:hypothetical protein